MPLVVAFALALVAGLLTGLVGSGAWGAALAGVALGVSVRRAPPHAFMPGQPARLVPFALALVGASASGWGDALARRDAACAARVQRAHSWMAQLDADSAVVGSFVFVRLAAFGCESRSSLLVASGDAPAGAEVVVTGAAELGDRGLAVREAHLGAVVHIDGWAAMRARAAASIDTLFGDDAPMARALLVADMRGLAGDERVRWADAGIVHMLSISGLHVAILGEAIALLLGALRVGPRARVGATVALLGAYILMLGCPPPAVRSGVMLAAGGVGKLLQRPTSPWAPLAPGALVPVAFDVRTVLDLGWQLSVGGMASLIATGALAKRVLPHDWSGWKRSLAREALTSVVATAVTAPLVAAQIGRLSLIAPLTNLVAAPIMAFTQPALFLALAFSWARPVGKLFAASAHPLLAALDKVAVAGAAVPGGSIAVSPVNAVAACAALAAVAAVVACVSRWPARPLILALIGLTGCVWWPGPAAPRAEGTMERTAQLELHVIDVGQGDALALRTPHGEWVVMDAGREWPGGDAGTRTVVPYLKRRGAARVRLFVLSHAHADHVGGAAAVLAQLGADELWDGAWVGPTPGYKRMLTEARTRRIPWHRVHPGDTRVIDSVEFTVIAPDSAWVTQQHDANEASVVVRVRYGAVTMLLTGDAEGGEEAWMRAHADTTLRADVLKVGHHGSRTSTTAALLDAVAPRLAVISVGRINTYGHPSPGTLSALARAGVQVVRTDRAGTVVVRTDGRAIEVEAGGERWPVSARVSRAVPP